MIAVFQRLQQAGQRGWGLQLPQRPGGVAGHHQVVGARCLAQHTAQGINQQADGFGVLAAHAPKPPGGVVALAGIVALLEPLKCLSF